MIAIITLLFLLTRVDAPSAMCGGNFSGCGELYSRLQVATPTNMGLGSRMTEYVVTLEVLVLCVVLLRSMACSIPIKHLRGNEALMLGHAPLPVAFLIVAMVVSMVPIFKVPVGSGDSSKVLPRVYKSGTRSGEETSGNKRLRNVDEEGGDGQGGGKNPKRGRFTSYHPDELCTPCTIWSLSGADPRLLHKHPQLNTRHAGVDHQAISNYVSTENVQISLVHDNCICSACHRDFLRNNERNMKPRWLRKKEKMYGNSIPKHCVLCCSYSSSCSCQDIAHWGPTSWYGQHQANLNAWKDYLTESGVVGSKIPVIEMSLKFAKPTSIEMSLVYVELTIYRNVTKVCWTYDLLKCHYSLWNLRSIEMSLKFAEPTIYWNVTTICWTYDLLKRH